MPLVRMRLIRLAGRAGAAAAAGATSAASSATASNVIDGPVQKAWSVEMPAQKTLCAPVKGHRDAHTSAPPRTQAQLVTSRRRRCICNLSSIFGGMLSHGLTGVWRPCSRSEAGSGSSV